MAQPPAWITAAKWLRFGRRYLAFYGYGRATGTAPAPSLLLTGPTPATGSIGSATAPYTVTGINLLSSVVVTPTASAGTVNPVSLTLTPSQPAKTFTVTPSATGVQTVGVTNGAGLANPSSLSLSVSAAWPPAVIAGETTVWPASGGNPIDVPADFLGLHYNPGSGTGRTTVANPPTVVARSWRQHDGPTASARWHDMHTGAGTYNWAPFDAQVAYYHGVHGMTCNFVLYGTPEWLRSIALGTNRGNVANEAAMLANTTAATDDYVMRTDQSRRWRFLGGDRTVLANWQRADDNYGILGGHYMPNNLTRLGEFITALVTRYQGKIKQIECWNEANIGNIVGTTGFWEGLPGDSTAVRHGRLAQIMRTVHQAAKAVDPNIIILAPSVTDNGTALTQILNGDDGAGGFGRDWCDGVSGHPYRGYGWSAPFQTGSGTGLELSTWMATFRTRITNGGLPSTTPIYITEIGYYWDHTTISGSVSQIAQWIGKSGLRAASEGVQQWIGYRYDDPDSASGAPVLIGSPAVNASCATALNNVKKLCGRRLLRIDRTAAGTYRATTDVEQFVVG